MSGDKGARHLIPGGTGVEAAIDLVTLVQQRLEPARVGPGTGDGETAVVGMEVLALPTERASSNWWRK
jgi:hypothetical protein